MYNETGIVEYISVMSNAAATHGEENAYLVWSVHNDMHELSLNNFKSIMTLDCDLFLR